MSATENMSSVKATCLFCGGDIVRCGNGWSHTAMHDNRYNHEGTPYLPVAYRLPAELKVEPSCGCEGMGCKRCEGRTVLPHRKKLFGYCEDCRDYFDKCIGSAHEPKEAAPEAAGPLVEHHTHEFVRCMECAASAPHCGWSWCGAQESHPCHTVPVPEPATEGAPETIAAEGRLDDRFTFQVRRDIPKDAVYAGTEAGAYLMLKFPSKPPEPKAEGAEKSAENKRPRRYTYFDDAIDRYDAIEADAYIDALESRNAELEKELEIHKTRHHGLTDLQEVKAQLVWTEREVERLRDQIVSMHKGHLKQLGSQEKKTMDWATEAAKSHQELVRMTLLEPPESAWSRAWVLATQNLEPKSPPPAAPPYQAPTK